MPDHSDAVLEAAQVMAEATSWFVEPGYGAEGLEALLKRPDLLQRLVAHANIAAETIVMRSGMDDLVEITGRWVDAEIAATVASADPLVKYLPKQEGQS
jgi:hypothetical protein